MRMSAEPVAGIGDRVRITFFDAAPEHGTVFAVITAVCRSKCVDTTWCYYVDAYPNVAWHGGEIELAA